GRAADDKEDDGADEEELRRRDARGLHDLRHVAEVRYLVAHRRQQEDRAQQHPTQDRERAANRLEHGFLLYARSNNRTSDGPSPLTATALSSVTATPSPAARSLPSTFTLPRRTCNHAARPFAS